AARDVGGVDGTTGSIRRRTFLEWMRRALRQATADEHMRTETAFADFDLAAPRAYGAWLQAHARAFPAVGAAMAAQLDWPPWRARWAHLAADLDQLGLSVPDMVPMA